MSDHSHEEEFLAAASEAVRRSKGNAGLDALGWWEFLADLSDVDARTAVFALFRAQGRELGDSGALSGLLAHPYPGIDERGPGTVGAAVMRTSRRRGQVALLVGPPPTEDVLFHEPGGDALLVPVADLQLVAVEVPGHQTLHEVVRPATTVGTPVGGDVDSAFELSMFLGRVAASHEILGAAEAVLALAVEYATVREQFGQPIGSFQAVRHLLAWARAECAAVEATARQAVSLEAGSLPGLDRMLKALAGRNGRRVCERTLQTFGGIGFTEEHDHHHFHSRVLALDSVLGTSPQLMRELGAELRQAETMPRIPAAMLGAYPTQEIR